MSENNKLNVLFLTFWTPPSIRPRAIAIGKLMPELIKQGVNPVIITYENQGDWEIGAPVHKIPKFKINSFLGILKLSAIFKYFYFRRIRALAEKLIKKHDIKVLFSFSNPQDSNIVGAMLKRKTGIPFISYFSDPWYDNSYKNFSGLAAYKALFLEKFVIKNSDRAVFINDAERNLVMRKYPLEWKKKTEIAEHCYVPSSYITPKKRDNKKFIFSYMGVFYKQRNPDVFLKAVAEAIRQEKTLNQKIKIKFIGGTAKYGGYSVDELNLLIDKYKLDQLVEILPPVEYKKSLEYMGGADCLIAIDADVADSICTPSKLFDYAGSGNQILGITPENSPTQKFLLNLGYKSFTYDQVKEIADYIIKIIDKDIIIKPNKEFLDKFNVQNITAKYIKIFSDVIIK